MKLKSQNLSIIIVMAIMAISYIIFYVIRSNFPTGERPVFSDGFLRDGIMSRWKPPIYFSDDINNCCSMDIEDNMVLIIEQKKEQPSFFLRPLSKKRFEISFRQDLGANSPLQSKSILLAARENTVFFVKENLDFRIAELKPNTAATMRKAIEEVGVNGKRIPDFKVYIQKNVIQGHSEN